MPDMTKKWEEKLKDSQHTMEEAYKSFDLAVREWFEAHGAKLTDNHFLRCNPVKVFWSKERTRFERTADLVLKAETAAMNEDKVLVRRAVDFAMEWPNA